MVGTADMNPAHANSVVDRRSVVRLGVSANISFLDASYAWHTARMISDNPSSV